jgi:hypothetical protein
MLENGGQGAIFNGAFVITSHHENRELYLASRHTIRVNSNCTAIILSKNVKERLFPWCWYHATELGRLTQNICGTM